ncbi:hypothetical protein Tco_0853874, partial [Tanacetum coccineum]
ENEDAKEEGPTVEDEDPTAGDEGLAIGDEGPGMGVEYLGLGGDEAVPEGQQRAAPVGQMPSIFEVGQSFGSMPESERPKRVSALRQPTLTTWIDIEDAPSIVPSPMISLTVPSPVASPATAKAEGFLTELGAQVEMQGGLIRDHTVQLGELSPALFKRYDRDIRELFTRSGAVTDEIFSQIYQFRSQTDAHRAALWHAISDTKMENQELRLHIAEERRALLDLVEIVDSMRRGQEPKGDV